MKVKLNQNDEGGIIKKIITGICVSVGVSAVTCAAQMIKSMKMSVIDVGLWDNSYDKINRTLYKLNPEKYAKNMIPTTNKEAMELTDNVTYVIKLDKKNYAKVQSYKEKNEGVNYPEPRLKIEFYGKDRYKYRQQFLIDSLRLTDEKFIRVQYLNNFNINCDVIPHSFDNIVTKDEIKKRINGGLKNWENSKGWYEKCQLVHKIGVFLYGKPGTGKSTMVKAISTMFNNAPILTLDPNDIMNSISGILKMRKRYDGILIVLIEDFDMFFKSREELDNIELDINGKKQKDFNQNAIFQLLDGVYSTEDTIYIATTNYKDRIDPALIRYGRFDIQEELDYFNEDDALKAVELLGYDADVLEQFNITYPIQPALLQSKVMEYRAKNVFKGV